MTSNNLTYQDYLNNFPLPQIRPKQENVLRKICDAHNKGYKYIVLEAPTGFGKSAVAICAALTLGSSYTCSATKNLQTQYHRDFPFVKSVRGMDEHPCLVKEDFNNQKSFKCAECGSYATFDECEHKSVSYGPCRAKLVGYGPTYDENDELMDRGCRYKPRLSDYEVIDDPQENKNTIAYDKQILYDEVTETSWSHFDHLDSHSKNLRLLNLNPCSYYDELDRGILSRHTIFNYSNFQIFLRIKYWADKNLRQRKLMIFDEGHTIENQVINFVSVSMSILWLGRYIKNKDDLKKLTDFIDKHDYSHPIQEYWIPFLKELCQILRENISQIESSDKKFKALEYLDTLSWKVTLIKEEPSNWIVTNIDKNWYRIEFKPFNVSKYCEELFTKGQTNLIMSATILDVNTFCRNIGIPIDEVYFIEETSDFPLENRLIYPLNTAYLNYHSIRDESVQKTLTREIDRIMDYFSQSKGIIHTTSYEQVRFIERFLSLSNKKRLIATNPKISRDEIIAEHCVDLVDKPTVLISPSLFEGLDLKDDLSRFQIIVKIPYPNKGDRWTDAKRERDSGWYNWNTTLRLVQSYGRSIRSENDYAKTFILDSGFSRFIEKNRVPQWFKEAIKTLLLRESKVRNDIS